MSADEDGLVASELELPEDVDESQFDDPDDFEDDISDEGLVECTKYDCFCSIRATSDLLPTR